VYHLVNLISESAIAQIRERRGRGRERELQSVVAFICDIDTSTGTHKSAGYPTQAGAIHALEKMPLAPSIVNLSGPNDGGLHVYWLLDKPVDISQPEARCFVKVVSQGWQAKLRAILEPAKLDSTFDLVRVLRIAGCLNHKYGVATRPITLRADRRYQLSDIARHVEPAKPRLQPSPVPLAQLDAPTRVARCRRYLARLPAAISGSRGHDRTFQAACECFRFGLSRAEALTLMHWFNQLKTRPDDRWSETELRHKVDDACNTVQTACQFGIRLQSVTRPGRKLP
jgi:hypothetical protein